MPKRRYGPMVVWARRVCYTRVVRVQLTDESLRRVVWRVAVLNLGSFRIEFAVALAIGSVSLFADSIDFLEDASVNFLIIVALRWTARWRARLGMLLAGLLLAPSLATLDGMGEIQRTDASQSDASQSDGSLAGRRGSVFRQSQLRLHVGELSRARRQPDAGGVSLVAQ